MKTLSVVIPVYNEKNTITQIIDNVNKSDIGLLKKEIIIIDDCSSDGTQNILKDLKIENLKIVFNKENRGKGYSIRKGFEEVKGDFVIIQDADLEYNPEEYAKLLKPILENKTDVVYGSRFLQSKFVFKPYYLANRFLTLLSNFFTGLNLTDMETCYKCFSRKALDKIKPFLSANKFEIEPEITAVVAKNKLRIIEVPISYNRRSYASGKKIGWKDGLKAILTIIF